MVKRGLAVFALGVALLMLPLPALAATDSFSVFVGYSDNLRPSGFFPTPWCGDGSVASCQVGGAQLDAGAVRVQDTGTTAITISDMTVTLNAGSQSFSLWSTTTINPGQNAIFGQTAEFNFDTSDSGFLPNGIGIDGAHPLGGCTNPGALSPSQQADCVNLAPVVSFKENGNPVSFKDTGNILNTFGYDFVCCSSDGNESIAWNNIGSVAHRGVPEPGTVWLFAIAAAGIAVSLRFRPLGSH